MSNSCATYKEKRNVRYAENGTQIENLTYQYNRNTSGDMVQNRLYHVNETVAANTFSDDIDDQGVFSLTNVNTTNNYGYDGEGRLVRDDAEEIASIKWTVTGKVKEVNRTSGSSKKNLKFRYDAMGQRIAKEVYDSQNNWEKTTFYVRDPQGNVMAIYDKTTNAQSQQISYKVVERDMYGSSRVGLNTIEVEMIGATTGGSVSSHVVGEKQYEISNHLGNVLSIVADKVLSKDLDMDNVVDYFRSEIVNASDYTPFGVQMDGRKFAIDDYRYHFNGKESDDEIKGEGNSYDFGARMYDSRLGRWHSIDMLKAKHPESSPYIFANNNPNIYVDVDGNDIVFFNNEGVEVHRIESNTIFRTMVTVPDANSVSLDFEGVANNIQNEPAQSGWMEAPMPGIIKGYEDPIYQQNDYIIAAEVATFNWQLHHDPESLPTATGPGGHQLANDANMPSDLDPTLVKAIEIQESGGTPRNRTYGGDVMTANNPGDWAATSDMKISLGLSKGQVMNPTSSINAGIDILYIKGLTSDASGNLEWRNETGDWGTAVDRYNGGGVANYQQQVMKKYNSAFVGTAANYVMPRDSKAEVQQAYEQQPQGRGISQCED